MLNRIKNCLLVTLIFSNLLSCAQPAYDYNELLVKYPFIQSDSSFIIHPEKLNPLFKKLSEIKTDSGRVVVAHIGDSHVQAGFFSEPFRRNLQAEFGFAGRGLIFPFQTAGTNGPSDYRTNSAAQWEGQRNSIGKNAQLTGVSGHRIYTRKKNAKIDFSLKSISGEQAPEKLILFHGDIRDSNCTYRVTDSTGNEIGSKIGLDSTAFSTTVFNLSKPLLKFSIAGNLDSLSTSSVIYGVSAENNLPGTIFHTIGVNGAEYRHYLAATYFSSQLAELHPDLIIISLGTNEAFNAKNFDPQLFFNQTDSLIDKLQKNCPGSTFILTTPPEIGMAVRSGKKKKTYHFVPNPRIAIIREQLFKLAENKQLALWDFYTVMGGPGAMDKWSRAGLTDKRRIHFNRTGYSIQGYLMWKAFYNAYQLYRQNENIGNN